jgi:polysaccharide biosynthesis transport protein
MIHSLHVKSMSVEAENTRSTNLPRPGISTESQRTNIDFFRSLKRHWFISLLIFTGLLGAGGFVLWKKDRPVYEAHSVVYVSPKFPKILANDNEFDLPYDSYIADQLETPARYDIVEDAIAKLPYAIRHRTGPATPDEIQALQRKLEVKRIGESYEMSIGLTGPSPMGLAEIVNAITDTYVGKTKNEEFYGLDDRLATLHQEQDRLQKQMDDRLSEQAQLMKQLGMATIASGEGAENPYDSTSQTVREQLAAARMDRQAAEARYETVMNGSGSAESAALEAAADDSISTDAGFSLMRSNLNARRATLLQEMSGMRSDNPIYRKDKGEMDSIDGQLNELRKKAAQRVEEKLRQDVTRTRAVELQLIKELGTKTLAATAAAPKFQRAAELGPEIDSLQKAYDAISDRIRDLELESSSPGSIHVSTKALPPLGPEKSKLISLLIELVVVSVVFAISAPVVVDLLDKKIYTSTDVEKVVGFHPFGLLVDHDEFRQEISNEYYFRLAAGVDHAVRTSGVRTFLFTSPAHGGGTTTVIRRLNEELRGFKLKTRTITASSSDDWNVPSSNVPSRNGHLIESRSKTDEIKAAPLTPLTFFSFYEETGDRGDATPNPVAQALHQASTLCDVVLIDADPLPISGVTEYLARLADATVLIVKSGTTTKDELDRAARLLERLQVPGVAVILNNIGRDHADRAFRTELSRYEQSLQKAGQVIGL